MPIAAKITVFCKTHFAILFVASKHKLPDTESSEFIPSTINQTEQRSKNEAINCASSDAIKIEQNDDAEPTFRNVKFYKRNDDFEQYLSIITEPNVGMVCA